EGGAGVRSAIEGGGELHTAGEGDYRAAAFSSQLSAIRTNLNHRGHGTRGGAGGGGGWGGGPGGRWRSGGLWGGGWSPCCLGRGWWRVAPLVKVVVPPANSRFLTSFGMTKLLSATDLFRMGLTINIEGKHSAGSFEQWLRMR